jgi:DNA-binding NarL/FixJ family response regulator
MNGWSARRIARDLEVTPGAIYHQIRILCEQENVADRHELAAKLGASVSPPLNQIERACKRRFEVKELLLEGLSYREIAKRLGTDEGTIHYDTYALYRLHGVRGKPHHARRALAAKLGVELPQTRGDVLREKILELHQAGMSRVEMARELKTSYGAVYQQMRQILKAKGTEGQDARATPPPAPPHAVPRCGPAPAGHSHLPAR